MSVRFYLTDCSSEQYEGEHEGNHTCRVTISHRLLKDLEGQTIHILTVGIPTHIGRDTEDRPYIDYELVE